MLHQRDRLRNSREAVTVFLSFLFQLCVVLCRGFEKKSAGIGSKGLAVATGSIRRVSTKFGGKSRVISARSWRRAHCCVAAGLLTGATELSVWLGTIRAISPPFGASLNHSPTTFHTPSCRAVITTGYSPCSTPPGEQTNVRKRCEKLEGRIYYSFVIRRISGERLKPITGYLDTTPRVCLLWSRCWIDADKEC